MVEVHSPCPPVPAGRIEQARTLLERQLGPSNVLTSTELCETFARDESEAVGHTPDLVVIASSVSDVVAAMSVAEQTQVPITPRGAGTGRTGGAVPARGGILLSMSAMTDIAEVSTSDLVAVVQPGVVLKDVQDAVEARGLFYPPDPNSLDTCTIGGNIAENAGGPRAFKYGVTRAYVLGLEVVVPGGKVLQVGRRSVKGVVGYDMTGLMVGSEGTLGVVTQATLRLVPKPSDVITLLAHFGSARQAAVAVTSLLTHGVVPRCVELLDSGALRALRQDGYVLDRRADAMLLIEVDGDHAACESQASRAGQVCMDARALDVQTARSDLHRERLWQGRKELSRAVRKLADNKLSEDVAVPRSRLPDLFDHINAVADNRGLQAVAYGHAGDGNVHVNWLWNDDEDSSDVESAIKDLFRGVLNMGGTMSGEHGVGMLKAPYLRMEQSADLIELQRRLKSLFDPGDILNPGKIFPPELKERSGT